MVLHRGWKWNELLLQLVLRILERYSMPSTKISGEIVSLCRRPLLAGKASIGLPLTNNEYLVDVRHFIKILIKCAGKPKATNISLTKF